MHRVSVINIAIVQRMTLNGFYFENFSAFVMISLYHIDKCETVTRSHAASAVFILQGTKQFCLNQWKNCENSHSCQLGFLFTHYWWMILVGGIGLKKFVVKTLSTHSTSVKRPLFSKGFWNNKLSCTWVLVRDWYSAGRQLQLRTQLRWKLLQPMQINANADVNLNTCKEADTKDINP